MEGLHWRVEKKNKWGSQINAILCATRGPCLSEICAFKQLFSTIQLILFKQFFSPNQSVPQKRFWFIILAKNRFFKANLMTDVKKIEMLPTPVIVTSPSQLLHPLCTFCTFLPSANGSNSFPRPQTAWKKNCIHWRDNIYKCCWTHLNITFDEHYY